MTTLEGATALVTGASGGIGHAIARTLAQRGARICLVARDLETLSAIARELPGSAPPLLILPTDLTVDAEIDALVEEVSTQLDRLDVLVHAAGVVSHGSQETLPVGELDRQYRTNVRGPFALTQGLLPLLKRASGQVVFINSTLGTESRANVGQYAATKHALKALADSLRAEVNAAGIRVLSVYPGRTATPRQAELFRAEGRAYDPKLLIQPEDIADIVLAAITLPRTAEVTEIRLRPMVKSY